LDAESSGCTGVHPAVLTDARRFSPASAAVRVEADQPDDRELVRLRIIDRGPGVAATDRERMFAPFQRLADHSEGGVGLGLAIARGFAQAMGGSLTPSETAGGGLTMTVSLTVAS
jgi:signal transduction histidine kinase